MSTLTTDFTGTYDWPAEEARMCTEMYQDMIDNGYPMDKIHQDIIKERAHWVKVFGTDEQGLEDMRRFSEVFNSIIAHQVNFYL